MDSNVAMSRPFFTGQPYQWNMNENRELEMKKIKGMLCVALVAILAMFGHVQTAYADGCTVNPDKCDWNNITQCLIDVTTEGGTAKFITKSTNGSGTEYSFQGNNNDCDNGEKQVPANTSDPIQYDLGCSPKQMSITLQIDEKVDGETKVSCE